MRYIPISLFAVFVMGCATVKPFDFPDASKIAREGSAFDGKATLVVFRQGSFSGAMWSVSIDLDGVKKASLRRGTYTQLAVDPGSHVISITWPPTVVGPDVAFRSDFEAGKTYYFLYGSDEAIGLGVTFISEIAQLDQKQGEELMRRLQRR